MRMRMRYGVDAKREILFNELAKYMKNKDYVGAMGDILPSIRNKIYCWLYRCYNLSYLLLSFTKYKYTVYTGMYFHQNTSYQTQSFTYNTTQW